MHDPASGMKACRTKVFSGANIFSLYRPVPDQADRPLLLLLHGFPQNHKMWLSFASKFPEWPLLIPDLPGYGQSTKDPSPDGTSKAHSKRAWARDIVHLINAIHEPCTEGAKVIVYGHDRGARLAYRLALDYKELVCGLAVLDIVPTPHVWDTMCLTHNRDKKTRGGYHWVFLSAPPPIPETLIEGRPTAYFEMTISSWMGSRARKANAVKEAWVKDAIQSYVCPGGLRQIQGACEDYRAGATIDLDLDLPLLSEPNKVEFHVPVLVLYSANLKRTFPVDEIWTGLSEPGLVTAHQIGDDETGHFFVNEAEDECVARTKEWLTANFEK